MLEMENIMSGVEFFQKGGSVMYVLLLCSMFTVAIGLERYLYFRRMDSGRDFAMHFCSLMGEFKEQEARKLAKATSGVLAGILAHAMEMEQEREGRAAVSYMEVQSGVEISKFRRRLYYLNVIVTLAPLLGLLGTISGMISAFSVFHVQSGQAAAITGGVGEALIATAMGLCVAILALIVHAYFSQRLENIVTDMEQCFSLVERGAGERK